jgi:hypothetical protein
MPRRLFPFSAGLVPSRIQHNSAIIAHCSPSVSPPLALHWYMIILVTGDQTSPEVARMRIARRIHVNPHSKGNLGRSFEAKFRKNPLLVIEFRATGRREDCPPSSHTS